jgi:hypothetical protein
MLEIALSMGEVEEAIRIVENAEKDRAEDEEEEEEEEKEEEEGKEKKKEEKKEEEGEEEKKEEEAKEKLMTTGETFFEKGLSKHIYSKASIPHLKQIGDYCLHHGLFSKAEELYSKANDASSLFLLATVCGDEEIVKLIGTGQTNTSSTITTTEPERVSKNEEGETSEGTGSPPLPPLHGLTSEDNLTFASLFLSRDIDGCVDFLLSLARPMDVKDLGQSNKPIGGDASSFTINSSSLSRSPLRAAEAAFFARTFAPWRLQV